MFIGKTDAEAELQYFGHLMRRVDSLEKTLILGGIGGRRRRGQQMDGWHHWLDGHEFEWTLGVGDGQGGLACCYSWGHKESDTTAWLNWTELNNNNPLSKSFGNRWLRIEHFFTYLKGVSSKKACTAYSQQGLEKHLIIKHTIISAEICMNFHSKWDKDQGISP